MFALVTKRQANHLIAINYTLANETVVSSVPVSDEFPGLVSSLIDPITGAFYDRLTNRLYFFKGKLPNEQLLLPIWRANSVSYEIEAPINHRAPISLTLQTSSPEIRLRIEKTNMQSSTCL